MSKKAVKSHKMRVGGQVYFGPVLFHVLDRDELGRPKTVEIGYDNSEFKTYEGMTFFTGFVHASSIKDYEKRKGEA